MARTSETTKKTAGRRRTGAKKTPSRPPRPKAQDKDLLFILDIGTRSVIGVAGRMQDGLLQVLCVDQMEHSERAVVDGQIEDIEQTAKVAGQVKARMEKALGVSLREVHVAAAGRVLKTEHVICDMPVDDQRPIGPKELAALESAAVQKAYEQLTAGLAQGEPTDFCCVGHTVVGYQLDGYTFSTLTGHKGRQAGIDLIATFLPSEVVESLHTAMAMLGLSVGSMTLEPIAAMNAVVPKELRLLNVALVDVGAGTSDIAVADRGSVCGYTMATIAGDEVTERVMQEFLVDFSTAEKMKFAAAAGVETIEYADVLGFPYSVGLADLLQRIRPTVQELAQRIAQGILSINGAAPKAVFMVGGGSRTPELCTMVAQALGVEENKVAIGGNNYMKRQIVAEDRYLSAEYATPIGIAVTAMTAGNGENFAVHLNGSRIQLLGIGMTVMEALRRGGYQYNQIMGSSGKSVVYEYNGERRIARGGVPTLAEVRVNGALAGLSTVLQAGDEISFVPAVDGPDAALTLQQAVDDWAPLTVQLFGEATAAGTLALVNDLPADPEQPICNRDRVTVLTLATVAELLVFSGFVGRVEQVTLNGVPCTDGDWPLHQGDVIELLDPQAGPEGPQNAQGVTPGAAAQGDAQGAPQSEAQGAVQGGATGASQSATQGGIQSQAPGAAQGAATALAAPAAPRPAMTAPQLAPQPATPAPQAVATASAAPATPPTAHAAAPATATPTSAAFATASATYSMPSAAPVAATAAPTASAVAPLGEENPARPALRVTLNGIQRILPRRQDGAPYQFFDLLNYVDIDPEHPKGEIQLRRNGERATYLEDIQDGDRIDITWSEES